MLGEWLRRWNSSSVNCRRWVSVNLLWPKPYTVNNARGPSVRRASDLVQTPQGLDMRSCLDCGETGSNGKVTCELASEFTKQRVCFLS